MLPEKIIRINKRQYMSVFVKKLEYSVFFLSAILLLINSYIEIVPKAEETVDRFNYEDVHACWISYLDYEIYLKDKNEEQFREKVKNMYDRLVEYNINTVIVQVRAMGDSIYESAFFPWALYISSDRTNPGYDPFAILIEEAHKRKLRIEAWINPYRISNSTELTSDYMRTGAYNRYKNYIICYDNDEGEKCLAFDPAMTETVKLIVANVQEIINRYEIDGIHMDDYFYVDGMNDDLDCESKKMYVNSMVSQTYLAIKQLDAGIEFGISPAGNIENARNQGADVDSWLSKPEYVDYVMPQIYWSQTYYEGKTYSNKFETVAEEWKELNKLNLPMYVGLALYRVDEKSTQDLGWSIREDNICSEIEAGNQLGYKGYALFRYEWFERSDALKELNHLKKN